VHLPGARTAAFLDAQSCQKPSGADALHTTKINHLLCALRFMHYLKVMGRDKVGAFIAFSDVDRWLNDWIGRYVHDPNIPYPEEGSAECPLVQGRVEVRPPAGGRGPYEIIAWLNVRYQLEKAWPRAMRFVGELPTRFM
jgi:type VI secretion system protein ImpC